MNRGPNVEGRDYQPLAVGYLCEAIGSLIGSAGIANPGAEARLLVSTSLGCSVEKVWGDLEELESQGGAVQSFSVVRGIMMAVPAVRESVAARPPPVSLREAQHARPGHQQHHAFINARGQRVPPGLAKAGVEAAAIHGNKSQGARQRGGGPRGPD